MKKMLGLTVSLLTFSIPATAAIVGPYVGLGGGYGLLRTPTSHLFFDPITVQNTHSRGGIAGRAFIGFNLNKYIGFEGGFAPYTRSKYHASTLFGLDSTLRFEANTADVVAKVYLPISTSSTSAFNLYVLGGVARVFEQIQYSGILPITIDLSTTKGSSTTHINRTRPIYGAGAGYDFTCHWSTHIEYTQIQQVTNSNTATPFINLATLNLSYHFG